MGRTSDHHIKQNNSDSGAGGVGVWFKWCSICLASLRPEFKPQYYNKEREKKKEEERNHTQKDKYCMSISQMQNPGFKK
jgi:hypothetical protein